MNLNLKKFLILSLKVSFIITFSSCQAQDNTKRDVKKIVISELNEKLTERVNKQVDTFLNQKFPDKTLIKGYSYYPTMEGSGNAEGEEFIDSTTVVTELMLANKTDTILWAVYFSQDKIILDHEIKE